MKTKLVKADVNNKLDGYINTVCWQSENYTTISYPNEIKLYHIAIWSSKIYVKVKKGVDIKK